MMMIQTNPHKILIRSSLLDSMYLLYWVTVNILLNFIKNIFYKIKFFIILFQKLNFYCYSFLFIIPTDDFSIESFSNRDDYILTLFLIVCGCSGVYIISKLGDDYYTEYLEKLFKRDDVICSIDRLNIFKLHFEDDRFSSLTHTSTYDYGILWTKVIAFPVKAHKFSTIVNLPSSLTSNGVLVDLVGTLTLTEAYFIAAALTQIIILYQGKLPGFESYDQLFYFIQTTSCNYSPLAKAFMYDWAQDMLKLHFGSEYASIGYDRLIDVHNPVVDLAQIIIKVFELPYLLN